MVESVHTIKGIRELCPQLTISGNQIECVIGSDRRV